MRKKRRWVCVQVQEEETNKKEDKRDKVSKFQQFHASPKSRQSVQLLCINVIKNFPNEKKIDMITL